MTKNLIEQEPVLVKKSMLKDVGVLAGLDRGCTLTKILYVTEADNEHYRFNFALFDNRHFDEALQFLKQQQIVVNDKAGKLRVTGTGGSTYEKKIKQELGFETEFVDEAVTQFAGFHFLVKNFADSDVCYPTPEMKTLEIERSGLFSELLEQQAKQMNQSFDVKFPCLFCIFGSSAGIALVQEDGSIEVKHRHLLGGKSFLGACQLLLGTSNYQQVMELATKGNRGNIDSQARDLLDDAPGGPYGRLPPSMAVFSFGKAADFGKTLEDTKPEDLAHSLVSCFVSNFYMAVSFVARKESVQSVYFGGNFCQHEVVQKEVLQQVEYHGNKDKINVKFLKTGHTGAVGAMLSSKSDVQHFFSTMKILPKIVK